MKGSFFKYHGTGNDFILMDNRSGGFVANASVIAALCHRRFGIGADGLILLGTSEQFDFGMQYFNSDGKPGSMCGNGGRCAAALAHHLGIIGQATVFEAVDGPHNAEILDVKGNLTTVSLKMQDVTSLEKDGEQYILNTGSPHCVVFDSAAKEADVVETGRNIRYSPRFRENGINVNVVAITESGLFVRTYERGVEDETLSCGTGVVASAIAFAGLHDGASEVEVHTRGGVLHVSFTKTGGVFKDIRLRGAAIRVFKGEL
jgi:diaminopimelate epimerase